VDEDADNRLCIPELESWIKKKTEEHFDEGLEENEHIFKHLDPDGDGRGYPSEQAKKHVEDYDIDLDYQEREQLIRYKFKWTEADINPIDNKLSKEEFLAFRHPEQSTQALANMVKTIMESLDKNEDHVLTEDEFVTLPLGDIDDEEQKKLDNSWKKQRSVEFRNQIDADHDGKATDKELLMYIDPRSEENARVDAKSLVDNLDDDNDSCISWSEIEDHKDIFIESKVVNVRRILHDEF
ncbi:CAB45-like protein, partial [Mya arenaria]